MKLYSVRKIDKLGRICIPKEYTRILDMNENDSIDIQLSKNRIILKKHNQTINYEMLISNLLVERKGEKYKDYLITEDQINKLKNILYLYIDNLVNK